MTRAGADAVTSALSPLPTGYREIFERLHRVCEPDPRICALWLSGSVGRGVADAGSDLDVVVTVTDEAFDGFCRDWRGWLATITDTIIAQEIVGLPGSFYSVTPGCQRFDVVAERTGDIGSPPLSARLLVLDRDGTAAALERPDRHGAEPDAGHEPTADDGPTAAADAGPDVTRLAAIVQEFFRQQAIFPAAVVARADWLLGVVGVVSTQRLLYDLFVETNQPLPAMGVKQWSAKLTRSQRTLLESLPVPNARREEVVASMLAVRRAMLTAGRAMAEQFGVAWPVEMDNAVAAYYARELGTSSTGSDLSTSPTTRIARPGE